MAKPRIQKISPRKGPTSGGVLIRITGEGIGEHAAVFFGDLQAEVLVIQKNGPVATVEVRAPALPPGVVSVTLENLDASGKPITGELVTIEGAFQYLRPRLAQEADVTRLVRKLLKELKKQILQNTSMAVAVDYDGTLIDGIQVAALSTLPAVVLSGPRLRPNRFYSTNEIQECLIREPTQNIVRCHPPFTVDLAFSITVASDHTVELLNLMAAVVTFVNRNPWIEMLRDPEDKSAGAVHWELDSEGEIRTHINDAEGVHAFSWGLIIRGFDIDEGMPFDISRAVGQMLTEITPL